MPSGTPAHLFPEDMKEFVIESRKSPIYFIKKVWKLQPQTLRKDTRGKVELAIEEGRLHDISVEHFMYFRKKRDITWQQWVILLGVERALAGTSPQRISVRSGHGIGKALSSDDYVPTPDGRKRVDDIKMGDRLFGENGEDVKVLGTKN